MISRWLAALEGPRYIGIGTAILVGIMVDLGTCCVIVTEEGTRLHGWGLFIFWVSSTLLYLIVVVLYVGLVASRVRRVISGASPAHPRDLTFLLIIYATAIFIFAGCYTGCALACNALGFPQAFQLVHTGPLPLDLVYFSAITFTGVGYGDIVPVLLVSRAFAGLEAILGHLFSIIGIGVVLSSILQNVSRQSVAPE